MRHLAAALIVLAGLVGSIGPSHAQVCPPVAALPDSERRVAYAPSASTGPFSVTFSILGDSTDYSSWLEVWLNGVRLTGVTDWQLTIPSGTLATACRPITNASVTLTAAATGTLQIVGARRPRRTSQFSENRGVAARDLNQVITDIVAVERELWDKTNDMTGRGLFSQPGVTLGPLPLPAACANGFLGFNSTGLIPQCLAGGAGSGNVVGPATSTAGHVAVWNNATGSLLADSFSVAPLVPTASAGTSTTQAASTAFVQAAIALGPCTTLGAFQVGTGSGAQCSITAGSSFSYNGNVLSFTVASPVFELGSGAGNPSFDFHTATAADYDARLRGSGGSGVTGAGSIDLFGSFTISPVAATMQKGLSIFQSGPTSGTVASGTSFNQIVISSDNSGGTDTRGFTIDWSVGGSNVNGQRAAFEGLVTLTASPNASGANIVGGVFGAFANAGVNGQATSSLYGANIVARNRGTNFNGVFGLEINMASEVGSAMLYHVAVSAVKNNGAAVSSVFDAAYNVSENSSDKWSYGYVVSDMNGAFGVKTTGTILGIAHPNSGAAAPPYTVAMGVDFSLLAITGSLIKGTGSIDQMGSTSGNVKIATQAIAGTPTVTWGTATGTPAVTASSPLAITAATGNITCATCVTSSGGGAISGTAPIAVSAAGVVSITGAAGTVLAGATPAFTATPTLGASGTLGSITFGNATSGLLTLQPATGALGTVTVSIPAATDTIAVLAASQAFTNKTYNGNTWTAGTGTLTIAAAKTLTDTSGVGAVLLLGATGGGFTAYAGGTCTSQFVSAISAAGAITCSSPTDAEIPLTNTHILVGNASNVAVDVAAGGDVTLANTGAFTIINNAVTLAKLATQVTNTVLGNATSGTAVPTALAVGTCSTAGSALIWTTNTGFGCNTSITAAAVAVGGITGLGTGVGAFLATPSAANFVAMTTLTTLSSLTTVGTIGTGTWQGTVVAGLYGGTGLSTAAVGDIIYASATTPTWSRLADVATGSVLVSGGVNTAPAWSAAITVTTSIATAALSGTTSTTSPLIIGGSGTTGTQLTLKTTTGNGTTDALAIVGGNNGATTFVSVAATATTVSTTQLNVGGTVSLYNGLRAIQLVNASASSFYVVGQGNSNAGQVGWNYDATPGNADFRIATVGYSNNTLVDGLAVFIQAISGGAINLGTTATVTTNNGTTDASSVSTGSLINKGGFATNKRVWMNGLSAAAGTVSAACQINTGEIAVNTGVVSCLISGRELKHNIRPLSDMRSSLLAMKPRLFDWNDPAMPTDQPGFIADEVPNLFAALDAKGKPFTWRPETLTAALVQGYQGHDDRLATLEAANDNLRTKLEELKRRAAR